MPVHRIAGITGHQSLREERWIRDTLRDLIADEKIEEGLTSLAEGADQIFTNCLVDAGIRFRAILPCRRYEEAFDDPAARQEYSRLVVEAAEVEILDYDGPSEAAFLAAGKRIVEQASILIAVWDGAPAKGLGGTGDVVQYARLRGERVIHVDCVNFTVSVL